MKIKTLKDIEQFTHWKPGDIMVDFTIGTIAVVEHGGSKFAIVYFDKKGRYQGEQRVCLEQ